MNGKRVSGDYKPINAGLARERKKKQCKIFINDVVQYGFNDLVLVVNERKRIRETKALGSFKIIEKFKFKFKVVIEIL